MTEISGTPDIKCEISSLSSIQPFPARSARRWLRNLPVGPAFFLPLLTDASYSGRLTGTATGLAYQGLAGVEFRFNQIGLHVQYKYLDSATVCIGEYVGLEEIGDGIWNVYFGPLKLGRLNERHMRIEDQYGRLKRKTV